MSICICAITNIFLFLFKGEDVEVKQQCIEASSATHMVGANQLCECRICKKRNVTSFVPFQYCTLQVSAGQPSMGDDSHSSMVFLIMSLSC